MFDGEAFGAQIVEAVKLYVADLVDPLHARIAELEKRPTAEVVAEQIAHAVREAVGALPAPVDGKDGRDGVDGVDGASGEKGQDGDPGRDGVDAPPVSEAAIDAAVAKRLEPGEGVLSPIAKYVQRWLEQFPPAAGPQGDKGDPGRDAEPVSFAILADAVFKHLEAHPPAGGRDGLNGKDGRDGVDGQDGAAGQVGERGAAGADGQDGVGLAGALIDREGQLVITLTNGEAKSLGPVVGRDGVDGAAGAPGQPGLGFDDLEVVPNGDRGLKLRFMRGEQVKTFDAEFPMAIYRGVFKAGGDYVRGDTVTFGGSLWHCNGPTQARPEEGEKAWTLAAKRGQNGRDGAAGKDGERGPQGMPGKDGKSWA